jgi:hypothetical protein
MSEQDTSLQMFVTTATAPMGPWWRQRRAAELAGEGASPLNADEAVIAVARLGRWEFRRPAHFAVAVARRADVAARAVEGELTVARDIGGRQVVFRFQLEKRTAPRQLALVLRSAGPSLIAPVLGALALLYAFSTWANVGDRELARLDAAERQALDAARVVARSNREIAMADVLAELDAPQTRVDRLLQDLHGLSRELPPETRLVRFEWSAREYAVEGETGEPQAVAAALARVAPGAAIEQAPPASGAPARSARWTIVRPQGDASP